MSNIKKKKVLGRQYSTYHGRVRIPFVSPYTSISLGEGIYFDSGCPGHVILGAPESKECETASEKSEKPLIRQRLK